MWYQRGTNGVLHGAAEAPLWLMILKGTSTARNPSGRHKYFTGTFSPHCVAFILSELQSCKIEGIVHTFKFTSANGIKEIISDHII